MAIIGKYTHQCLVESGPGEGNTYVHEVNSWDVEGGGECENCGRVVAPLHEIIAHIYRELTD